jgi:hypothetical protein
MQTSNVIFGGFTAGAREPVLELSYHGEVVGLLDCACAFAPSTEDQAHLNAAIIARLAA